MEQQSWGTSMPVMLRTLRRRCLLALFAGVAAATIFGCGTQAYEHRLAETARYYEYRQRVDTALERNAWQQFGVELRAPKGFQEIPGPTEEGQHDARHPNFFRAPLPGLIGAWQGEVAVDIPNRDVSTMPAWIFVCTNHQRFLDKLSEPTITPHGLKEDLTNVLATELRYEPDTALNRWQYEEVRAPQGTPYVPRKTYEWIILDDERIIDGSRVRMEFRLVRFDVKEIQFCMLTVVPHEEVLDRRDWRRFYSAIDLAMENLVVSGDPPRAKSAAQSSGGGF